MAPNDHRNMTTTQTKNPNAKIRPYLLNGRLSLVEKKRKERRNGENEAIVIVVVDDERRRWREGIGVRNCSRQVFSTEQRREGNNGDGGGRRTKRERSNGDGGGRRTKTLREGESVRNCSQVRVKRK